MTSERVARDHFRRAHGRRQALDGLLALQLYADVVRESQDIVELILKGALRFVGVEPPKRHDVHDAVGRFIDRFPAEWRGALEGLRAMLDELAADRVPAFYGTTSTTYLFGEEDGRRAMAVVDRVLDLYRRLLGQAR